MSNPTMFTRTSRPAGDEVPDDRLRIALAALLAVGDEHDDAQALGRRQVAGDLPQRGRERRLRPLVDLQTGSTASVIAAGSSGPSGASSWLAQDFLPGLKMRSAVGTPGRQRLVHEAPEDVLGDVDAPAALGLREHAARRVEQDLHRDAGARDQDAGAAERRSGRSSARVPGLVRDVARARSAAS